MRSTSSSIGALRPRCRGGFTLRGSSRRWLFSQRSTLLAGSLLTRSSRRTTLLASSRGRTRPLRARGLLTRRRRSYTLLAFSRRSTPLTSGLLICSRRSGTLIASSRRRTLPLRAGNSRRWLFSQRCRPLLAFSRRGHHSRTSEGGSDQYKNKGDG